MSSRSGEWCRLKGTKEVKNMPNHRQKQQLADGIRVISLQDMVNEMRPAMLSPATDGQSVHEPCSDSMRLTG